MAWERLAHAEITGSAGILTTGTFTAKKNLRVILYVTGLSVNNNTAIVFNTDNASSNYGIRGSVDGGSDYSHGSQPAIVLSATAQDTSYSTFNITNVDGKEKLVIHDSTNTGGSGSGNTPSRREGAGKWATTSGQITKITVTDNNGGTGSITCGVGSYITVLGAKEPATADVITVDCGTDANVTYGGDDITALGTFSAVGSSGDTFYVVEDTTNKTIDVKNAGNSGVDSSPSIGYIDLGSSLSSTAWVLRYKLKFNTMTAESSGGKSFLTSFGIVDEADGAFGTGTEDGFKHYFIADSGSTQSQFKKLSGGSDSDWASMSWTPTATTIYVEMKFDSGTCTTKFYSDEFSTQLSGTSTVSKSGSFNDLRYFQFVLRQDTGGNGVMDIEVSDLKIYDGITEVTSGKKHLMIQVKEKGSGSITGYLRFNNDTGNNYAYRTSENGASDGTSTSQDKIRVDRGNSENFITIHVINEASKEKLVISECVGIGSSGAGNAPQRWEAVGKWANTSNAITRVDIVNTSGGDFTDGSEVTVYGTD